MAELRESLPISQPTVPELHNAHWHNNKGKSPKGFYTRRMQGVRVKAGKSNTKKNPFSRKEPENLIEVVVQQTSKQDEKEGITIEEQGENSREICMMHWISQVPSTYPRWWWLA
ncbi:unnamed protein product [Ilex paraguariensis]|uniref:Uncharacterized protein n=1 Tax=Ilex paraguariensis TaxID=185542 RepID=A0ABC8TEJ7_9AQUA